MQPTEPPLSIRQPNWHRMEKQAASPRRSSKSPPSFITALLSIAVCLNRKLLTTAGVSICTERVSSLAVTAIATVCVHAALGAPSPRETALVDIWSQYEELFKHQTDNSHAK